MSIDPLDERVPFLSGRGRYIDDVAPAGCLHVAFLRSPFAAAEIVEIDTAAAETAQGVVAVLTGRELARNVAPIAARMDEADWYSYRRTDWPAIAVDRVRFAGELVAAVVATDPYRAEDACTLIEARYEPADAVADVEAALAPGATRLHSGIEDNTMFRSRVITDPESDPIATAPVRVAGRFRHPRVAASPIECGGCVAVHDARLNQTDVYSPSQAPHMLRDGLARFLDIAESRIRVIPVDIGGGFGVKMPLYPEEIVTVFAARRLGRPVKWAQDRIEHLLTAYHARDAVIEAELGATRDGRILGLRAQVWCDSGAYSPYPLGCSLEPHTAVVGLPGPYVVPWYDYAGHAVATNKCPTGPYRGVGFALAPLVTEGLMDGLARRTGIDRAEIRRRNMVQPSAHPFRSASGAVLDSGDYPALLDKALDAAGYASLVADQRTGSRPGRRRGVGLSCFIEPTGMGCAVFRSRGMSEIPAYDAAQIRIARSGDVEAYVSVPAMGQLPFNAMRAILARKLGIAPQAVAVRCADTSAMPHGSGAFASRGLVSGGGALQRAADKVIARMIQLAAIRFDVDPGEVTYAEGRFGTGGNQFATFAEIAAFAHAPAAGLPEGFEHGLTVTASFTTPGAAVSSAVHVAVVEVDTQTGEVAVIGYTVAEDCGRIANPEVVEAQIKGAVIQGIGTALLEEIRYDHGQLQTGSFADYLIPAACEGPDLRIVHQQTPSPLTEGGYKGMGESGTIGAPAAVASAIIDALECDVVGVELPITPQRVLDLLSR